ncbi:hypothetical protein [Mitsuaria sp. GD03876]|uniref:hypothetical protein n=1 Tax=Mitsuaria sp. GD03876 TaxID=2975399 RepID=UPI0024491D6A|nr:hypothetical protein [Mitsuaria sp. GD03876]MDH0868133.1 hypothetical protein [Mitsuaria sp. GD03876]
MTLGERGEGDGFHVPAIVRRHVEDGSFYWLQIDACESHTGLGARRAQHFSGLLQAHLDGLRASAPAAVPLALSAVQRWRKPGEAFAALHAAFALPPGPEQAKAVQAVFTVIAQAPDLLLRGAVSALSRLAPEQAEPWLLQALQGGSVPRVAALRAHALNRLPVPDWTQQARHESAFVRAAACRAAQKESLSALHALRDDDDLVVRAESMLAWARLVPASERGVDAVAQAAGLLWRCVVEQLQHLETATGWNRLQARRRLARWLRHLAWIAPLGHPGVPQLLAQLPPRLALSFVLHHGDPRHLAFVLRAMRQPDSARWALWVWRCLTGVDPLAAGLTLPDPPPDLDAPLSEAQQDSDHGLPLPEPAAVAAHPANRIALAAGERLLMGQPVQAHGLRALLDPAADQPQALRFVAANALAQLHPAYALNLRASPKVQAEQLVRMGLAPQTT